MDLLSCEDKVLQLASDVVHGLGLESQVLVNI